MKFWHPLLFLPVCAYLACFLFVEMNWVFVFFVLAVSLVLLGSSAYYYVQQKKILPKPIDYSRCIKSNLHIMVTVVLFLAVKCLTYKTSSFARSGIDFKTYIMPYLLMHGYVILVQGVMSFYYFRLYKKEKNMKKEVL